MSLEAYRDDLKRSIKDIQEQLEWTLESNSRLYIRRPGEAEKDITAETVDRYHRNIDQLTKIVDRIQRRIDGEDA
ncbi:hypothetical protein F3X89_03805 [Rhizobium rhizogenes]|uniref:hypothetical protein n=1 Tax=Rhizobium rhizogenes TaxID=359 RepID=UPI00193D0196|nr:hypothetical protein [Rhizobium rhizogenes]QRM36961.1 hypothetical protein F3X89_03805 [Rhizobium rhizogenes]